MDLSKLQAAFQIGLVKPVLAGLFQSIGTNAARYPFADDFAIGILVAIFEFEQILGNDNIAFHPDHLCNLSCPP